MEKRKTIAFPTFNVSDGMAIDIVKDKLNDETIPFQTRILAIDNVANMATHNSVSKDELVSALKWIFEHYDFE
ncbi:hypothetical protein [Intestinibacillus sp. Marseille-P6563]|uniref:hypothetical protein n=1 Tax=Intestinibacillus sp. Marseille-P6563 TaxID=2364792 RepID=UPI000F04E134|nr:hypothetical protein [Intestinibacillus sp. Marseille-P6563]